jgi:hypothetical protein
MITACVEERKQTFFKIVIRINVTKVTSVQKKLNHEQMLNLNYILRSHFF